MWNEQEDKDAQEKLRKAITDPAIVIKKLGRLDALKSLPSRHDEIDEHFRDAYIAGYSEALTEVQDSIGAAELAGHRLGMNKR
jgi:hypothetical protein